MIMIGKSPITQSLLLERGPDDFVANCLEEDVMKFVILDKAGPFFLTAQSQNVEQIYILVAVELVTYHSHLVPMKDTSAKSLIRALEQLQSIIGKLSTIILEES